MKFLLDNPDTAVKVIAHEPPVVNILPDAGRWLDFFHRNYDSSPRAACPPG
jgi:hypothetical protein